MNKLSTQCFLTIFLFSSISLFAQNKGDESLENSNRDNEVVWYEDFDDGFESSNGDWTVSLEHGELWFITNTAQYSPISPLPNASDLYGDQIPLFYENTQLISSPTRTNGIAMIDGDRWNSTATAQFPEGDMTTNPVFAILESPPIDLSATPYAELSFYTFSKFCCSNFSGFVTVDLSTDGGENWNDLGFTDQLTADIGEPNDQSMLFDISDILVAADDLTDCRIRFRWNGGYSHFFWMLDDIEILALPQNDLIVGKTFYSNYIEEYENFQTGEISANGYYNTLEYKNQPEYYAHPLNFAAIVTNAGAAPQTNVQLGVTATAPNGDTPETFSSPGITLAAGATDTLRIPTLSFSDIADPISLGEYFFDFIVTQSEEDENLDNNIGESHSVFISGEPDGAIMQNTSENYNGTFDGLGQDIIWGSIYSFPQNTTTEQKVITHVEAVFMKDENVAETAAGELVFFNVRRGSVFGEDENIPSTLTTVLFDSDDPLFYDAFELEYEIQEEDIWDAGDNDPFIWTSFELPTPVLIDPTKVYQAEFRIPAAGGNIVFQPYSENEEPFITVSYDYETESWLSYENLEEGSGIGIPIRFRTAPGTSGIDKITAENGLELVQNYPNPFTDLTNIQYRTSETADLKLEIRDLTGKVVFNTDLGTTPAGIPQTYTLQRGDLAAGVYTYTILSSQFQLTRKLTVD